MINLARDPWDGDGERDSVADLVARHDGDFIGRNLPIEWGEEIEPSLDCLWLIKGTLPRQGLALIYGHPGSGKSFLAIDIAMHVALGLDWQARRVDKGVVIYIAAEGQRGLRNRIVAFRQHHEIEGSVPLAMIPCPVDLHDSATDRAALSRAIRCATERYAEPPVLIIIDTISKTLGAGKENTDDLAVYVSNCGALAAEFNCCVLPVHHRPKDAESTEPRGHGSLKAGVDTVILVESGKVKRARITKQKDGEEGDLVAFSLLPMTLGVDQDGDPVTSCVIKGESLSEIEPYDPFARAVSKLSASNHLIYDQLAETIECLGVPIPSDIPDGEIDRMRVGKVALLDAWRDKSISAAGTGAGHDRDTGKRTFNRSLKNLINLRIIKVWNDWAWITFHVAGT